MDESSSCPLEAQEEIQQSYHSDRSRGGHVSVKEHSLVTDEEHKRHQTSCVVSEINGQSVFKMLLLKSLLIKGSKSV